MQEEMQTILNQLKLRADVVDVSHNDVVAEYYLKLRPGGTVKRIENRASEIALGVQARSVPIVKPILERGLVSLEMIVGSLDTVNFDNISDGLLGRGTLPIAFGRRYTGEALYFDLVQAPHMLVAGTTGSGKSIMLHSILCSLMHSDANAKFVLVDPKNVEFNAYKNVKQLMAPVINNADDALLALSGLVDEMEGRFARMSRAKVNTIDEYNSKRRKKMPHVMLVIDEFSDLMQQAKRDFQRQLARLAQKSRACGIHIVLATQRPSADVVTGIVKANFPTRVSFAVTSRTNSRVILDESGAEKLLGAGDGLMKSPVNKTSRFRGTLITSEQIKQICKNNKRSFWNKMGNLITK